MEDDDAPDVDQDGRDSCDGCDPAPSSEQGAIDDDDDDDDDEALLGEGSFGKLVRMKHIPEDALRAVKVIKISKAKSDGCSLKTLLSEASILDMLAHESIVRYWGHLFCGTVKNPTLQKCKLLYTRTLEPCLANMTVISDCALLFIWIFMVFTATFTAPS